MFNQHRILRVFKLITLLKTYPAKTIRRLSQSLEVSERSTYRYLDLLAELGFEVKKDLHNKFSLGGDQIVDPFTKEEAQLIHEVLSVSVKNNPLVASIKAKLPSMEVSNILSNNIVSGHLAKLVTQINESIASQRKLLILKYQSASSESISDRLVEPIGFTSNYQYLCAFEVESKQNKYFKIERMGSIELTDKAFDFVSLHKLLNPDVFGFNEADEQYAIKILLSMRAQLWLRDDYPDTVKYLEEQSDGSWLLEVTVNSMEPVNRIIRSMPGEVTLIQS